MNNDANPPLFNLFNNGPHLQPTPQQNNVPNTGRDLTTTGSLFTTNKQYKQKDITQTQSQSLRDFFSKNY